MSLVALAKEIIGGEIKKEVLKEGKGALSYRKDQGGLSMPKLSMPKTDNGFYGHYNAGHAMFKARPIQTKVKTKGK